MISHGVTAAINGNLALRRICSYFCYLTQSCCLNHSSMYIAILKCNFRTYKYFSKCCSVFSCKNYYCVVLYLVTGITTCEYKIAIAFATNS